MAFVASYWNWEGKDTNLKGLNRRPGPSTLPSDDSLGLSIAGSAASLDPRTAI